MDVAVQMSDVMVWRREPMQGAGRGWVWSVAGGRGGRDWGFQHCLLQDKHDRIITCQHMVQSAVILTGHHEREQPPAGFHHRRIHGC